MVDCCSTGDELTGFVSIVNAGLSFIGCLLIRKEFASENEFGEVRRFF